MLKVNDKVRLKNSLKIGEVYNQVTFVNRMEPFKNKDLEVTKVFPLNDTFCIKGSDLYFAFDMIDYFKVGDEVYWHKQPATIWGIKGKSSLRKTNVYAITAEDEYGNLVDIVVNDTCLSYKKSKNELKQGDKFIYSYDGTVLTVKNLHVDPDGLVWYFAVNQANECGLYNTNEIELF